MTHVLGIGKFDALHLGHRALALAMAGDAGPVALLSFSGMAEVLGWDARSPLVAPDDRARILADWSRRFGIAVSETTLPFAEVRGLDPTGFLRLVRERFATEVVVVGDDFRGGRDRHADAAAFTAAGAAVGIRVRVVPAVLVGEAPASSSRARAALERGKVAEAAAVLGRPHRLLGTVVRGDGRGRSIGIPTANLGHRRNLAPGPGVYAAWAWLDGRPIPAAVNIGRVPTVGADRPLTVEAHLIGHQGDCYDADLGLEFIGRLRDERRFAGLDDLVAQIRNDLAEAERVLGA